MGFELVGNLCLSLSEIVSEARMVAKDPTIDGFGHHNPQLGQEDDLFYNTLSIDQMVEGLFRGRDLSANESQFVRLIRMGILDGREGFDMPMTALMRAMRHMAVVTMRLWAMLEGERQRVHSLGMTLGARAPITSGHMLNTLRIQSISDHNVSSGQESDAFKMYPVM